MGRLLERSISPSSRARKYIGLRPRQSLAFRVCVTLFIVGLFYQQHLFHACRDSLAAKYAATDFNESDQDFRIPSSQELELQETLLANRDQWRTLGAGYEGKTFIFNNSVIKTFTPGRSPFRNCAPGLRSEKWPTEIPASLIFGGTNAHPNATSSFLPVQAYFKAASTDPSIPEWHLVTPLLPSGNILNLAKRLKTTNINNQAENEKIATYRTIDSTYRPTLHSLLASLSTLHAAGYCHDDVKPSNIFVSPAAPTSWVVGDLGNLRHVEHGYHATHLWRANGQMADCRMNDLFRGVVTYLRFVRASAADGGAAFDEAFWGRREEGVGGLYWGAVGMRERGKVGVKSLVSLSERMVGSAGEQEGEGLESGMMSPRRRMLKGRVERALDLNNGDGRAKWAGMTAVFGVKVEKCGV
ncbi:hypothetical protein BU24DRAFT_395909 [Aaosphaeria arxii CBS 175.79]|uniref:Protein kinase domain-containing protein n=1 Tax=Aaosphaeria arxii CBS 175.79 TaxID=1450172 RepID=A0A6A5XIS5_9PLEO|nr:uncharacterized protein BU24DRAFT_395909 [Aaosphaeria arxii CBS 175.79]KAF2012766.1 hypothetical protein BU24DRAFT_395909 [Aaosphaeria arxii CBS 175.79]